jgi:ankyrin repeat protein
VDQEQQFALDSALVIGAARGQKDIVKCVLKAGANIHVDGDAALIRAAEEGHAEVVEFLLFMGADPHGDKALLRAAQHGQVNTLRLLFNWADQQKSKSSGAPPTAPTPPPSGPA